MSKFCTKCGKQLNPGDKYCGNCGTKVTQGGKSNSTESDRYEIRGGDFRDSRNYESQDEYFGRR